MASRVKRCPVCRSINLMIEDVIIENIEYEVTDDFLIGTRVTKRKKKKIIKADKIKVYKCNECGNVFETKTVLSLK